MINLSEVDKELLQETESLLEDMGIDWCTVRRMVLKRIIRERSIAFITASLPESGAPSYMPESKNRSRMTKRKAVALFEAEGLHFNHNITFASKNNTGDHYWSNPNYTCLDSNWYFILNDWIKEELHLFLIPKGRISRNDLIGRADDPEKVDLQIWYNDPTYTDKRSKVSFAKFHAKSIKYNL